MIFEEALKAMREGKKVRRKNWSTAFLMIGKDVDSPNFDERIIFSNLGSNRIHDIKAIDERCIMGDDWEVIEEE